MTTQHFLAIVRRYLDIYQPAERFFKSDKATLDYFNKNPLNEDPAEILIKVRAIAHDRLDEWMNDRQSITDHIAALHIDEALRQGSPSVVKDIAHLKLRGHDYFQYSFATRYCNWHNRAAYPIYDLCARKLLSYYWREVQQQPLSDEDFLIYPQFKSRMMTFRDQLGMRDYNFKELDTFIWVYGDRILDEAGSRNEPSYFPAPVSSW